MNLRCPKCRKKLIVEIRLKGVERIFLYCNRCDWERWIEIKECLNWSNMDGV